MGTIVGFTNQKGGVGKTRPPAWSTLAHLLEAYLKATDRQNRYGKLWLYERISSYSVVELMVRTTAALRGSPKYRHSAVDALCPPLGPPPSLSRDAGPAGQRPTGPRPARCHLRCSHQPSHCPTSHSARTPYHHPAALSRPCRFCLASSSLDTMAQSPTIRT